MTEYGPEKLRIQVLYTVTWKKIFVPCNENIVTVLTKIDSLTIVLLVTTLSNKEDQYIDEDVETNIVFVYSDSFVEIIFIN